MLYSELKGNDEFFYIVPVSGYLRGMFWEAKG